MLNKIHLSALEGILSALAEFMVVPAMQDDQALAMWPVQTEMCFRNTPYFKYQRPSIKKDMWHVPVILYWLYIEMILFWDILGQLKHITQKNFTYFPFLMWLLELLESTMWSMGLEVWGSSVWVMVTRKTLTATVKTTVNVCWVLIVFWALF